MPGDEPCPLCRAAERDEPHRALDLLDDDERRLSPRVAVDPPLPRMMPVRRQQRKPHGEDSAALSSAAMSLKARRSRFHSTVQPRPAAPARSLKSSATKQGWPGASASNGRESAARMLHRVAAALGVGVPPARTMNSGRFERAAASASLRVATRSSVLGLPHGSISTAPSGGQRAASSPARNTDGPSRARTRISRSGERPSSARPGA